MATIDLNPQVLDIKAYGGDTVPIEIRFPPGYVAGRVWKAQVRAATTATKIDAEFLINLGPGPDDPVTIVLTSAASRALVTSASLLAAQAAAAQQARTGRGAFATVTPQAVGDPLATYKGVWDCQLAPLAGGDPTTTVAKGSVELTLDVTRLP